MLLKSTIDPHRNSEEYGVDIYLEVLSFVEERSFND